jgi:nucleoside phosphorylase
MLPLAGNEQQTRDQAVLYAFAQAAAETWLVFLALNPAALLDLPEIAQVALAELLIWALGSYADLNLRLSLAGLADDVEGRMLRRRLMQAPNAIDQIEPPSSNKLLNWLSIRPPGLLYTYLITRCRMATTDTRCQEQAIDILNQASDLERRGVIVKLFMPSLTDTPPGINAVALTWMPQRLEQMLSARMGLASNNIRGTFRDLFGPMSSMLSVDPDRALAEQANGSLHTMLELGNRIVHAHVDRHLEDWEYTYLDQVDLDVIREPSTSVPKPQSTRAEMHKVKTSVVEPTIAIITALPHEYAAVKAMLENQKGETGPGSSAGWQYLLGEIPAANGGRHSLVLSLAGMGTNVAASCATFLLTLFPSVDIIMMVGIAGGAPFPEKPDDHVRLGDVVVSNQYGVVQYDFIKQVGDRIEYRNPPRPPSAKFLRHANLLVAAEISGQRPWMTFVPPALKHVKATRPSPTSDILVDTADPSQIISHPRDPKRKRGQPRIFIGPIASGNKLLKSAYERDDLRDRFGVKAVEMEGSGIADAAWSLEKNYLVIRGICDYCDANKNDGWQMYAAVVAAAYARALIESVPC